MTKIICSSSLDRLERGVFFSCSSFPSSASPPYIPNHTHTHTHAACHVAKMAARSDAAAYSSPFQCFILLFVRAFTARMLRHSTATPTRNFWTSATDIKSQFQRTFIITTTCQMNQRGCRTRRGLLSGLGSGAGGGGREIQKPGRRSGLLLRLKSNPHKPPLPSQYLTNARSIPNRTDDLDLQLTGNRSVRDCCVLIITETWLHPKIPDASMQLTGRSLHR